MRWYLFNTKAGAKEKPKQNVASSEVPNANWKNSDIEPVRIPTSREMFEITQSINPQELLEVQGDIKLNARVISLRNSNRLIRGIKHRLHEAGSNFLDKPGITILSKIQRGMMYLSSTLPALGSGWMQTLIEVGLFGHFNQSMHYFDKSMDIYGKIVRWADKSHGDRFVWNAKASKEIADKLSAGFKDSGFLSETAKNQAVQRKGLAFFKQADGTMKLRFSHAASLEDVRDFDVLMHKVLASAQADLKAAESTGDKKSIEEAKNILGNLRSIQFMALKRGTLAIAGKRQIAMANRRVFELTKAQANALEQKIKDTSLDPSTNPGLFIHKNVKGKNYLQVNYQLNQTDFNLLINAIDNVDEFGKLGEVTKVREDLIEKIKIAYKIFQSNFNAEIHGQSWLSLPPDQRIQLAAEVSTYTAMPPWIGINMLYSSVYQLNTSHMRMVFNLMNNSTDGFNVQTVGLGAFLRETEAWMNAIVNELKQMKDSSGKNLFADKNGNTLLDTVKQDGTAELRSHNYVELGLLLADIHGRRITPNIVLAEAIQRAFPADGAERSSLDNALIQLKLYNNVDGDDYLYYRGKKLFIDINSDEAQKWDSKEIISLADVLKDMLVHNGRGMDNKIGWAKRIGRNILGHNESTLTEKQIDNFISILQHELLIQKQSETFAAIINGWRSTGNINDEKKKELKGFILNRFAMDEKKVEALLQSFFNDTKRDEIAQTAKRFADADLGGDRISNINADYFKELTTPAPEKIEEKFEAVKKEKEVEIEKSINEEYARQLATMNEVDRGNTKKQQALRNEIEKNILGELRAKVEWELSHARLLEFINLISYGKAVTYNSKKTSPAYVTEVMEGRLKMDPKKFKAELGDLIGEWMSNNNKSDPKFQGGIEKAIRCEIEYLIRQNYALAKQAAGKNNGIYVTPVKAKRYAELVLRRVEGGHEKNPNGISLSPDAINEINKKYDPRMIHCELWSKADNGKTQKIVPFWDKKIKQWIYLDEATGKSVDITYKGGQSIPAGTTRRADATMKADINALLDNGKGDYKCVLIFRGDSEAFQHLLDYGTISNKNDFDVLKQVWTENEAYIADFAEQEYAKSDERQIMRQTVSVTEKMMEIIDRYRFHINDVKNDDGTTRPGLLSKWREYLNDAYFRSLTPFDQYRVLIERKKAKMYAEMEKALQAEFPGDANQATRDGFIKEFADIFDEGEMLQQATIRGMAVQTNRLISDYRKINNVDIMQMPLIDFVREAAQALENKTNEKNGIINNNAELKTVSDVINNILSPYSGKVFAGGPSYQQLAFREMGLDTNLAEALKKMADWPEYAEGTSRGSTEYADSLKKALEIYEQNKNNKNNLKKALVYVKKLDTPEQKMTLDKFREWALGEYAKKLALDELNKYAEHENKKYKISEQWHLPVSKLLGTDDGRLGGKGMKENYGERNIVFNAIDPDSRKNFDLNSPFYKSTSLYDMYLKDISEQDNAKLFEALIKDETIFNKLRMEGVDKWGEIKNIPETLLRTMKSEDDKNMLLNSLRNLSSEDIKKIIEAEVGLLEAQSDYHSSLESMLEHDAGMMRDDAIVIAKALNNKEFSAILKANNPIDTYILGTKLSGTEFVKYYHKNQEGKTHLSLGGEELFTDRIMANYINAEVARIPKVSEGTKEPESFMYYSRFSPEDDQNGKPGVFNMSYEGVTIFENMQKTIKALAQSHLRYSGAYTFKQLWENAKKEQRVDSNSIPLNENFHRGVKYPFWDLLDKVFEEMDAINNKKIADFITKNDNKFSRNNDESDEDFVGRYVNADPANGKKIEGFVRDVIYKNADVLDEKRNNHKLMHSIFKEYMPQVKAELIAENVDEKYIRTLTHVMSAGITMRERMDATFQANMDKDNYLYKEFMKMLINIFRPNPKTGKTVNENIVLIQPQQDLYYSMFNGLQRAAMTDMHDFRSTEVPWQSGHGVVQDQGCFNVRLGKWDTYFHLTRSALEIATPTNSKPPRLLPKILGFAPLAASLAVLGGAAFNILILGGSIALPQIVIPVLMFAAFGWFAPKMAPVLNRWFRKRTEGKYFMAATIRRGYDLSKKFSSVEDYAVRAEQVKSFLFAVQSYSMMGAALAEADFIVQLRVQFPRWNLAHLELLITELMDAKFMNDHIKMEKLSNDIYDEYERLFKEAAQNNQYPVATQNSLRFNTIMGLYALTGLSIFSFTGTLLAAVLGGAMPLIAVFGLVSIANYAMIKNYIRKHHHIIGITRDEEIIALSRSDTINATLIPKILNVLVSQAKMPFVSSEPIRRTMRMYFPDIYLQNEDKDTFELSVIREHQEGFKRKIDRLALFLCNRAISPGTISNGLEHLRKNMPNIAAALVLINSIGTNLIGGMYWAMARGASLIANLTTLPLSMSLLFFAIFVSKLNQSKRPLRFITKSVIGTSSPTEYKYYKENFYYEDQKAHDEKNNEKEAVLTR